MRFSIAFFTALASVLPAVFAAPATPVHDIQTFNGPKKSGSFIVKLKDDVDKTSHLEWLANHPSASTVTHGEWNSTFFNGFAGELSDAALNALRSHPDVESISEDGIMFTQATVTQTNAPWGIARLSQAARLTDQVATDLTFTYRYDSAAGSGVDIYIVGINTAHQQFGGRARWGSTFGGYPSADGNGHGTHVAGTAAGSRFGVAKSANLIAVKVLSDQGSGAVSDIVSGLNFVAQQAASSGRPSIASMSLGGSPSTSLDSAVSSLVGKGVHVTVAAGNDNSDAANSSPARVAGAITVGASTIADARASFSNFGTIVDIFAPGQSVTSAWIGSTTATNTISGTSMATPHIAGLVAYLISVQGNASPASISSLIKSLSTKGALSGLPTGTINDLARNNI